MNRLKAPCPMALTKQSLNPQQKKGQKVAPDVDTKTAKKEVSRMRKLIISQG